MYKYYYNTRDDQGRFCKASHNPHINVWELVGGATIFTAIIVLALFIATL